AFIVFNETKKFSSRLGKLSIALFILPAPFIISLYWGNAGSILCCLLLICCVECDRRPILTGILLSLAMIKPQTALPFCILFLLQRRYKILLTAAAIDLGAWLIASALTATSPITLLIEMLNANVGGGKNFSGLMMVFFPDEPTKATCLSMLIGVIFLVVMHRRSTDTNFLSMHPACVTVSFWSYTTGNEGLIMTLPALCCFLIMLESDERRLMWLTAGVATQFYYTFLSMCLAAFGITGVWFCFVFIAMSFGISRRLAAIRR
ncbi:MAG: DUF2029 domain-containing protein, partial [Selenomonadaceae bacterium]|nr:DUF2029 domain-containing protein [Selenomonadaceae bacterium]